MANIKVNPESFRPLESERFNTHALISFRAIAAGLLISGFVMLGLVGLGLAFGGIGMDEDTSAQSAGIFTGVWFIVSVLISLFVGSYFAARVSKFRTGRIGSAQGLVIAALFLGFFMYETFSLLGATGSMVGSVVGKSATMLAQRAVAGEGVAYKDALNNLTEDALGDLNLLSEPRIVAQGLASRLFRGDTEGAKNYLARQAGITPTEADTRIVQMKAQVDKYVADMKEGAAAALRSTGWTVFLLVALGSIAAVGGGALGSSANFRKPLVVEREEYYPPGRTV